MVVDRQTEETEDSNVKNMFIDFEILKHKETGFLCRLQGLF